MRVKNENESDHASRVPKKPSELVWILWKDAQELSFRATDDDWAGVQLAENINVGFVVDEDSERVLLSHGLSTTKEHDVFAIPTNAIIARIPVVKKRERKPKV